MTTEQGNKKTWSKINVDPKMIKIIKRIAIDENLYVYQLIEDIFREKYPEYFRNASRC